MFGFKTCAMENIVNAIALLKGLHSGEIIARMDELYKKCDGKLERFVSLTGTSCPEGCGECCMHYNPFVTTAEALYVAAYMLFSEESDTLIGLLERNRAGGMSGCPLYDGENPHHCRIYPARPLTCRLFGSCCYSGKDGMPAPSRCRFNENKKTVDQGWLESHGRNIPQMEFYGRMLGQIDPEVGDETISEAVLKALDRLRFEESLLGNGA